MHVSIMVSLRDLILVWLLGQHLQVANSCCHGEIQLVNGSGPYEGRVEMCLHGTWKTVCHRWIIDNMAKVVCAQMGYPREGAVYLRDAAFGPGSGSIIEAVYCAGTEGRLIDCVIRDYDAYGLWCTHHEDVGVKCLTCDNEGEVRLQYEYRGVVEVCLNGTWGTVCDTHRHWDSTDSSVVCKQLGYSRYGSMGRFLRYYRYGYRIGPAHLDDIQCTGNEQRLVDCLKMSRPNQNCTSHRYLKPYSVCQPVLRCQNGHLRIVGGNEPNEGRVEICLDETWGTVCNNNWDQVDATVVCKQLGYSQYGAMLYQAGPGNGLIHLNDVFCIGNEVNFIDCQHNRSVVNCSHHSDAGVYCSFDTMLAPVDFLMAVNASNNSTLSWLPPNTLMKRHGHILHYLINCSSYGINGETLITNTTLTEEWIVLQPYTMYECCVFAVNEIGLGIPACQIFTTNEAAPNAPPTTIELHFLNNTSIFLSWRPPDVTHQNGIIEGYCVEFAEVNASTQFEYTTQEPYLFIYDLEPGVNYTCRIAAFTVEIGPFSEAITIMQEIDIDTDSGKRSEVDTLVLALALSSGVLFILLFISVLIVVFLCCLLRRPQKESRCSIQSPEYEMVDILSNATADSSDSKGPTQHLKSDAMPQNTNGYALESSLSYHGHCGNPRPAEYSSPITTAPAQEKPSAEAISEENTYQPLLPLRSHQNNTSVYQSLLHLANIQSHETPPPIPPKPKNL